jgi:hypothetical protein
MVVTLVWFWFYPIIKIPRTQRQNQNVGSYWVNPFFLKEYDVALKITHEKVSQIASLREIST